MYSNTEEFTHNTPQILKKKNKILHHVLVENEQNLTAQQ